MFIPLNVAICTVYQGQGKYSIVILNDDQWHIGMLASLPNNDDVIHYFKWIRGEFDLLSADTR
eukprot:8752210-Ditylum_brightwellii.AAC.1